MRGYILVMCPYLRSMWIGEKTWKDQLITVAPQLRCGLPDASQSRVAVIAGGGTKMLDGKQRQNKDIAGKILILMLLKEYVLIMRGDSGRWKNTTK